MKKELVLFVLFVIIIVAIASVYNQYISGNVINNEGSNIENNPVGSIGNVESVFVQKQDLSEFIQNQEFVNDLPSDAIIELRLFDNNKLEGIYAIGKARASVGYAENPDIIIITKSKYLENNKDFCSIIKNANSNGDVQFELKKSKTALLWKYKSMMKYKDCL